jgi:chemotaxis protein methyltransferase CheR
MKFALALGNVLACLLITTLYLLSPQAAFADELPKKVLIFSSDSPFVPGNMLLDQAVSSTVRKGRPEGVQVFHEALDTFRIPTDKYEDEIVRLLQRKYSGESIDLIYAFNRSALKFLLKHRGELFSNTPVVFISYEMKRVADLGLDAQVTGVGGRVELSPTLDIALALQPQTKRVVVVAGKMPADTAFVEQARQEFTPYEGKVEFVYLIGLSIEELQAKLASLPDKSIVFYLWVSSDSTPQISPNPELISLLAPSSSAPIYGTSQTYLGNGMIGGRLVDFEALGTRAGEMGLRIMAGESPKNIPPQTVPSTTMFDWRELHRFGIDEAKLPAGSVVRYREFSVWELYKWRIIGAISLIILQALLIIGLLINRSKRRQAEKDNERLAQLAEAERRRLDEVVSNVPGIVWEVRSEPGTTKRKTYFVSEYVEKMLGYSVEEWMSTPGFALSIVPEEDRERAARETQTIIESGKESAVQFRWMTKDGRLLWVESQMAPVLDAAGETIGLRGVTMDISDRKQAEVSLRKAHEEVSKLKNQLEEENIYLQEEIRLAHNVDEIIGESNAIKYVLFKIEQVAQTDTTVLILGETGTGKELVARAIHNQSPLKDRPLVKVNCAALSASLIESELFGHEKGAFTGASARKIGRFELADGATLFLDEIGELPLELQAKLLRVIQEGEFERLGGSKTVQVKVRIIAATNRNMKAEVEKGAFREDLWYRLNVFPITLPPLRQRKEDIPAMTEHFVGGFSKKLGKPITSISSATLKKLHDYSWPGNVRELANVIERAVINTPGAVFHIADQFEQPKPADPSAQTRTLEEVEKEYITRILEGTGWRIEGPNGAAKILGLNPSTLRTRMTKLGIQKNISTAVGGNGTSL